MVLVVNSPWCAGCLRYKVFATDDSFGEVDGGTEVTASMTGIIINGSYSTNFSATENPISEGGVWINGEATGIDWGNVATIPGLAYGTSLNSQFADPTAVLAGLWASDQWAQGTVEIDGSVSGGPHEVELLLNTTITPYSITGYEILFSVNPNDPYIQIVRWNGALNDFTYLNVVSMDGVSMGVADGDVVKATHIGNTITVYKNGTQVLQATDSTYSTGSPGIGFYDSVDTNWTSFGFSHFSAMNVGDMVAPGQPAVSSFSPDTAPTGDGHTTATTLTLSGTGEANSTIQAFDGTNSLGTANVDASGVWNITSQRLSGRYS